MFKKLSIALVVLLLAGAVGLAVWEPMTAQVQAPPPSREYDVRIARDNYGVPHIFGKTDADTAYGIAYAHAEDDFKTQQQVLAMTRGRAGALIGKEGAQIDYAFHLLNVEATVARDYDTLPEDVRKLLDGYAAGLNRYAEKHPSEVALSNLFPANGRDIAAGFVLRSPFFFGLGDVIGALVEGKDLPVDGGPALSGEASKTAWMTPLGKDPSMNGSNAFAVSPGRSTDGKTRLISNSHQPWRGQVAWYELVVHSEEGWDFAGATFPGSPYPFLGHNKYLGWTNTVNRPDLIDVYQLKMDGKDYLLDGKKLALEERSRWLKVKFGPFVLPIPQSFYASKHGPVIQNDKGSFAIRYGGMDQLKMLTQYFRIQKAKSLEEWEQAMAIMGVPATNFIYADAKGNIGLFYNAAFPQRSEGLNWRGVLPGDKSAALSGPTVDWAMVPRNVNPASGYIMNANNTPYVAAGPGDEIDKASVSPLLGVENDMTNRAIRAIELLEGIGKIGPQDIEQIKYDRAYSKASYAGTWMKAVLAVKTKSGSDSAKGQEMLQQWDWVMDGKGQGDALALILLKPAMRQSYRRQAPPNAAEELASATAHLVQHFGTLDPPLGTVLRLRQGEGKSKVDLPMDGGSDTLRAATLWDVEEDGRLSLYHGDSFIQFVEWDRAGNLTSRSIQPFGSATTRPGSKYHTDQAKLFVAKKTKPVYFTREQLKAHIIREYRP